MIKLQIIGRIGGDCVTNEVNGKNVINFNVAHSEKFKNASGVPQERTTWVRCAYWTDRLAIAPYLIKGQQVFVEGTPEVEAYKKQDGEPGASLRMRVREVQLLGSKADAQANAQTGQSQGVASAAQPAVQMTGQDAVEDDLPF